jgi:hypothetical protein
MILDSKKFKTFEENWIGEFFFKKKFNIKTQYFSYIYPYKWKQRNVEDI